MRLVRRQKRDWQCYRRGLKHLRVGPRAKKRKLQKVAIIERILWIPGCRCEPFVSWAWVLALLPQGATQTQNGRKRLGRIVLLGL